jgi:hypothetical protein
LKVLFAIIVLLTSATIVALANQERAVPFSTLRFESSANGRTGKVVVEAIQDEKVGLVAFKVVAFGKEHVLPKEQLSALSGVRWNGVRVIDDSGVFGRTIWIQLQLGFSTDMKESVMIRISHDESIELYKPETKKG